MKRPAFQFYPSDWRKDTALQFCSLSARGLWVEMMCIAHECEPYGHLVVNGKAMTAAQIGRLVGISEKECKKLLAELFEAGVPSQTSEGVIFSRRMVRDEEVRNKRAAGGQAGAEHGQKGASFGAKGGRPSKQKTPEEIPLRDDERGVTEPPKEPPPSSSSSSSPSVNPSVVEHTDNSTGGTLAGAVCARLKSEAMVLDVNPSHPKLLSLLEAGLTEDEIIAAGHEAHGKGKGFAYALAVAEGRRRDAASVKPLPTASPRRTIHDQRSETIAALTGRNRTDERPATEPRDINGEATRIA